MIERWYAEGHAEPETPYFRAFRGDCPRVGPCPPVVPAGISGAGGTLGGGPGRVGGAFHRQYLAPSAIPETGRLCRVAARRQACALPPGRCPGGGPDRRLAHFCRRQWRCGAAGVGVSLSTQ